ncbi:lipoprotein insertase outer membrane protein LolB [Photobacterium sp. DNB23_23_1]|uniref:Outer-membrane lipoprotein LolB n=1 Tax=Photobacterium pectinilyticum TaxID=2906793 RepID=A0ABT1MXY9_9GAMM|nr:lipoprotein insertase outer membrane protein LolB [Photobacterium sp. ZSDE20]MCQ1057355.1 lipoprotein insertase outer membrane protein LolB [Photobacterium sp. ZSDE20]MDD1821696.1 lipoprotein insertase outer membrane protein LolB [Photobacterium sp. ZSDE20]
MMSLLRHARHPFARIPRKAPWLALILSLLAGCATQAPQTSQTDWDNHEQALQALSSYQAKGKLGYKGKQRFGANLVWETAPAQDHLLLTNFLGSTLLKLDATPSRVTLVDNSGKTHQGTNASELVSSLTGINLPIEQMRDWLIGLPTAADTYQLNDENRVGYLAKRVDGKLWQLDYNEYDYSVSPALPKRMVLSTTGASITLIIHQWSIN